MGVELTAAARLTPAGGAAQRGKVRVLLETDELILRGGVHVRVSRASLRHVRVSGGTVEVHYEGGTLHLTLGDAATKFAAKLAEPPKSRLAKMGIGSGACVAVINLEDTTFAAELRASHVTPSPRAGSRSEVIVLGVHRAADIARIARAAKVLADNGALWIVHPRGTAGVKDTDIFAAAKRAGLTYTKVARFSDTHTAEKLVIPVASRAVARKSRRVSG